MSDDLRQAQVNTVPLRFSQLRRMAQSPAHYLAGPEPSSSAIDIGNAADALILDPDSAKVLAYPGAQRRGKEWEKWRDEHDGYQIVTQREYAVAQGMAASVSLHLDACRLLTGVVRETRLWALQGRSCRGTPDVRGNGFLADLKTGETSDPRRFPWKVQRFAYHAQLAWYQDGVEASGLLRPEECYIVAVEQSPPYVVTVFRLTPNVLDLGRRLYRLWFEHLKICEDTGEWPGYTSSIVDLDLPDNEALIEMAESTVEFES